MHGSIWFKTKIYSEMSHIRLLVYNMYIQHKTSSKTTQ